MLKNGLLHHANDFSKRFLEKQEEAYRNIASKRDDQKKFLKGWLNRLDSLRIQIPKKMIKNRFVSELLLLVIVAFSFLSCNNQSKSMSLRTANIDSLVKPFLGNWLIEVRDSMNFIVTIVRQKDTLFIDYSNVLFGGSILNAQSDSTDYAAVIPFSNINNEKIICLIKNYYDGKQLKLRLTSEKTKNILIWETYDFTDEPMYLPVKTFLVKDD